MFFYYHKLTLPYYHNFSIDSIQVFNKFVLSLLVGANIQYKKEDIVGMAISADSKGFISPCGMCRQVMSELMPLNTTVYLLNGKQEVKEVKVRALLPLAFDLKESK